MKLRFAQQFAEVARIVRHQNEAFLEAPFRDFVILQAQQSSVTTMGGGKAETLCVSRKRRRKTLIYEECYLSQGARTVAVICAGGLPTFGFAFA